jgi:hypothetical protein
MRKTGFLTLTCCGPLTDVHQRGQEGPRSLAGRQAHPDLSPPRGLALAGRYSDRGPLEITHGHQLHACDRDAKAG